MRENTLNCTLAARHFRPPSKPPTAMEQPTRAQLLQTARTFFAEFSKWTPDSVVALRTPDSTHRMLPGDTPVMNKETLQKALVGLQPYLHGLKIDIIEDEATLVDVEQRKVCFHLKSHADSGVGPYQNEYLWILTMSQDGNAVKATTEFVDSAFTNTFMPKLQTIMGKQEA